MLLCGARASTATVARTRRCGPRRALLETMPGSLRFVRAMRLVRRGDFSRAFARGSRARGEILLVVGFANGTQRTRLGLSVGRSIWRSAVKRNRVRRIFRESFRLEYEALPRGLDLVLVPARPALEPQLAATRKELVRLARKVAERLAAQPAREASARPDARTDARPSAGAGADASARSTAGARTGPRARTTGVRDGDVERTGNGEPEGPRASGREPR